VPSSRVGTLPGDLFRLGLDGAMTRSPFTAATAGPPSTVATGIHWSTVCGAFVVSGRLYTGHADGTMTARGGSWQSGPDRVPVSCASPRPCSSRDRAAVS
jgi:hypothetical protein